MTAHPFEPDWTVAPGDMLQEWMEDNAVTLNDLVTATNMTNEQARHLLDGHAPLDENLAHRLHEYTGISAALWINFETNYRSDLAAGKTVH